MPVIANLYNLGHIFFVELINILIGASMKDPFTMYKVFYRDCIYGLNFRYKRFDFDHELVIKLYRKGFRPIEIPVNYQARSFSEGKKVSFFKDGISWIQKDIQLANEPLEKPKLGRIP
ncbi:MAG: Glycosyl transferase family 2 [uncultured bacterium]|nr:MAG: Glycosyl transferase family 2 [uncultured bacterium]